MRLRKKNKIASSAFSLLAITGLLLVAPAFAAESEAAPVTLDFANGLYTRRMYETAAAEYERFILENPSSPEIASARFRLANSFYYLKKYAQAVPVYEQFIKDFPQDKRVNAALYRVGTSHFFLKDHAPAIKIFLKTSQYEPDPVIRAGSFFYLAKSYEAAGDTDKAFSTLKTLTASYPQSEYSSYASILIGDALLKQGKAEEAIQAYQIAAEKKYPETVAREARLKLGEIYSLKNDHANAAIAYEKAYLPEMPADILSSKALLGLFYCDLGQKDLQKTLKRLSDNASFIEKSASGPDIYYVVSAFFWEGDEVPRAIEYLDKALSHPALEEASRDKALLKKAFLESSLGQNEGALATLAKMEAADSPRILEALYLKGMILRSMGRPQEALTAFEALAGGPKEETVVEEALLGRATLLSESGENEKARALFAEFVQNYPGRPNAERAYLEWIQLEIDTERFDSAASLAAKFIQEYPKSQWKDVASYKLGVAHSSAKRFKEAAQAFKSIVENSPDSALLPEALYAAASCFESLGEAAEAIALIETLTSRFPQHELALEALPRLGPLYVSIKDFKKASAFYEKALLEGTGGPVKPEAAFWLVQYFLDQAEYAKMQAILKVFAERYPTEDFSHETSFFMGESFMGLGEFDKAIEHYTKSLTLKPSGPYAPHSYLGTGIAYAAKGSAAEAEKNFNEALKYDDETKVGARARYEVASLKLRAGETLEAAKAFMLVAILYDDAKYSPLSLYKAGECFQNAGKIEDGKKAFEELRSKYPQSEWAKKAV